MQNKLSCDKNVEKVSYKCHHHAKHRDKNCILKRMELEVEGRRPVGRPKKTWSKVVEEERGSLTSRKIWQRTDMSGEDSYHVQLQE